VHGLKGGRVRGTSAGLLLQREKAWGQLALHNPRERGERNRRRFILQMILKGGSLCGRHGGKKGLPGNKGGGCGSKDNDLKKLGVRIERQSGVEKRRLKRVKGGGFEKKEGRWGKVCELVRGLEGRRRRSHGGEWRIGVSSRKVLGAGCKGNSFLLGGNAL